METINKLQKSEILLSIIDECVLEDKRQRDNFMRKHNGLNPLPAIKPGSFKNLRATLELKNPDIDAIDFIDAMMTLRSGGVFYQFGEAECVKKGFESYDFELPRLIEIAIQEAELRNSAIKSFIAEKEYKWDKRKSSSFTNKIELDIKTYTYDHGSKLEYLKNLHSEKIKEIKDLEETALEKAGHYFEGFYTGDEYTFTDERWLNLYYYEAQSKYSLTFFDSRRLLIEYIEKRNEAKFIRELISKETDLSKKSIDREYIIDSIQLIKLHHYFSQYWIKEKISETDFKNLFCLDVTPTVFPEFKRGGKQVFCYLLSELKTSGDLDLTDNLIDERFNLSYRSTIQRINDDMKKEVDKRAIKLTTRRKIEEILKQTNKLRKY